MVQRRAITEGFDVYSGINTDGYGLYSNWMYSGNANIEFATGRFSGRSIYKSGLGAAAHLRKYFQEPSTQIVAGCAIKKDNDAQLDHMSIMGTLSSDHVTIRSLATGHLQVVAGGVVLCQSDGPVVTRNAWCYIEFAVTISATEGSVRVWFNDFELAEMQRDGVNTKGSSANNGVGLHLTLFTSYIDDVYCEIDGLERVGEGRIFTIAPNGDVKTDFTPSTSIPNYESVNQERFNKTLYNMSAVIGAEDIFNFNDLTFSPEKIFGIQVSSISEKDEAGARRHLNFIKSGDVISDGTPYTEALASSVIKEDYWALNPNTGLAWTIPAINALQAGYRIVG